MPTIVDTIKIYSAMILVGCMFLPSESAPPTAQQRLDDWRSQLESACRFTAETREGIAQLGSTPDLQKIAQECQKKVEANIRGHGGPVGTN